MRMTALAILALTASVSADDTVKRSGSELIDHWISGKLDDLGIKAAKRGQKARKEKREQAEAAVKMQAMQRGRKARRAKS